MPNNLIMIDGAGNPYEISGGGGAIGGLPIWGQITGTISDQTDLVNYINNDNRNFWFATENARDTYFFTYPTRLKTGVIAGVGVEDNYILYQYDGDEWQKVQANQGGNLTFYFLTDDWAAITDFTPYLNSDVILTDAPDPDPQPGGQGIWGQITGNLPDQTDLNNVLEDIYLSQRTVVVPMTTAAWEVANPQNYVGKQVVITDAPDPEPDPGGDFIPVENIPVEEIIPEFEARPVVSAITPGYVTGNKGFTLIQNRADTLTGLPISSDPKGEIKFKSNGLKFEMNAGEPIQIDTGLIYQVLYDLSQIASAVDGYCQSLSNYDPSMGNLPSYQQPYTNLSSDLQAMENYENSVREED